MEFFASGKLRLLAYANQKGELVARTTEWQEDGSLLRSEAFDTPKKPNLQWTIPPKKH